MRSPKIGMGPIWLQNEKLQKCSEFHVEPCDAGPADQCCAVLPCKYCLEWAVYGLDSEFGVAEFDIDTGTWHGTIINLDFVAYWEHGYETGNCEFVVLLDGDEIARLTCEQVTCRDSSSSVEMTIEYEAGTLSWTKHEKQPLPYVQTDDGCTDFFCGTSECTCKILCVNVRIPAGAGVFLEGADELPLSTYSECDGPEWMGSVEAAFGALTESIDVWVYLYRDSYTGECWISGTARDQELTPTLVEDCNAIDVTFTLYDGSVVRVKCKTCECESTNYCEFCCLPMDFTFPEYPAGVLRPIPFQIIGCGDAEGEFVSQPGTNPCSTEAMYDADYTVALPPFSGTMFYTDLPVGYVCPTTPCSVNLAFKLECSSLFAEPGDDNQCDRIRLWIGSSKKQVGDIGETPGGTAFPGYSWKWIRPTTCACDEVGGIAAVFYFDVEEDCTGYTLGVNGACAGAELLCCQFACSGTLII